MGRDEAKTGSRAASDMAPQTSSNMQSDSRAAPPDELTDVDLYCLHCGYNLRGLSGDPRRCPECGRFSPISAMTLPAEAITQQLRRMETWPTLCIAFVLLLMFSLTLAAFAMAFSGPTKEVCMALGLPVLILVPLWLHGVSQFSSACMDKPGWRSVLIEYHLYGLALCLMIAVSAGLPLLHWFDRQSWNSSWPANAVVLTILIGGSVGVVILAPLARRRCKRRMDVLQREVAVKLAGEYLQRRLSRGRF
ncbi:MAG: hypothetical protein QUV05_18365 [Phycisphaerae bacterium]|nr:hypothetical protein [Phycisphaerae bacterium]